MTYEQLVILLETNEPTEDMLREYIIVNCDDNYGHLHNLSQLVHLKQSKRFQGIQKLNLLIMLYNLVQEFVILDRVLLIPSSYNPSSVYKMLSTNITKVFSRVSSADKYSNFDHVLNISYSAVRKK